MYVKTLVIVAALASNKSAVKFRPLIEEAASAHKIDSNVVTAVISLESGFNPRAVGRDGKDLGLMQLRRGGACLVGLRHLSNKRVMDPVFNIQRGVACLAQAIQTCGGDLAKGLSRYNGRGCKTHTPYAEKVIALTTKLKVRNRLAQLWGDQTSPSHNTLW